MLETEIFASVVERVAFVFSRPQTRMVMCKLLTIHAICFECFGPLCPVTWALSVRRWSNVSGSHNAFKIVLGRGSNLIPLHFCISPLYSFYSLLHLPIRGCFRFSGRITVVSTCLKTKLHSMNEPCFLNENNVDTLYVDMIIDKMWKSGTDFG